ncbi:MAG: DUF4250 domain-containing protein [Lachnospiraceae bacterium]|jgi:hypothetical protein|nr:DUF4250 domain-containing protein [Lachnospiraceae bacterium]HBV81403.1 DUF4250 domain-containing protein [Lachnospiraceae bacterium]
MLPKDPVMLLSYINLKLRDYYSSLEAFCEDTDEDIENIVNQLKQIDYHYDREKNQFI